MRDALLLLFGAILSMIGGFFNQNYQNQNQMKKQDRENLFEALKMLIELKSSVENQSYADQHSAIIEPLNQILQYSSRYPRLKPWRENTAFELRSAPCRAHSHSPTGKPRGPLPFGSLEYKQVNIGSLHSN